MSTNESLAVVRLRLPYEDDDAFVVGYARHCRRGTVFLPTQRIQPVDARVRFELMTRTGGRLMLGEGRVVAGDSPQGRAGFFLRVVRLDAPSKRMYLRLKDAAGRIEEEARSASDIHREGAGSDQTEVVATPPERSHRVQKSDETDVLRISGDADENEADEDEETTAPQAARDARLDPPPSASRARRMRDVFGLDPEAEDYAEPDYPTATGMPPFTPDEVTDEPVAGARDRRLEVDTGEDQTEILGRAPHEDEAPEVTMRASPPDLEPGDPPEDPFEERAARSRARARAPVDDESIDEPGYPTLVGVFSERIAAGDEAPILGIDLGTCRSLVGVMDGDEPRLVPIDDSRPGIPSVVASGPGQKLLVGAEAMRKRLEQPDQTVFGSKRLLGRKFHSAAVQQYRDRFPYALVADEAGGVAVSLSRTRPTVTELTARILEAVKAGAEQQLGRPCNRAVLSVPAHFGDAQRAAVREAGLQAGLEVMRIVGEPTAAALAYGFGRGLAAKRLVVYDLGGGTFDVSVLTVSGDQFEVVATGGDDFLGGMDFDLRVVQRLLVALGEAGGPERPGPTVLERLLEMAERAKVALTESDRYRVSLPGLWLDEMSGEPRDLDLVVAREDLESWTRDLVDRTTDQTLAVLEQKGFSPEQIDDVLLVGGQSRMPLVQESLEALFGRTPRSDVDPEQAVALGCALLGGSIATAEDPKAPSVQLRDVLAMAIGLGVPDGRFMPVVEQNTPIPCERTLHVATSRDDQDSIEVVVFQGNVRYAVDAEYLGTLSFVDLPPRPAGEVVLQLRFTLDEEGLLSVQATDEGTGRSITRVLSTADSAEEVRSRLGGLDTVIRDLAGPGGELPAGPSGGGEDSGFLRGLRRKIFGRD